MGSLGQVYPSRISHNYYLKVESPIILGLVQLSPVRVAVADRSCPHPSALCSPAGAAVSSGPALRLEKRPGPGSHQPPGAALGLLTSKPRVSEESRSLEPGNGGTSVAGELVALSPRVVRSPAVPGVCRVSAIWSPTPSPLRSSSQQREQPGSLGWAFSEHPCRLCASHLELTSGGSFHCFLTGTAAFS